MKKFLLFSITGYLLWADGGILPPDNYEIYGADQVAIITLLPDSEELSILVKYESITDYQGFAWIIPLPALPEVNSIEESLFINLSSFSGIKRTYGGCGLTSSYHDYGEDYFKIIGYQTIGFLETVLIQTDDADSLINWLINNGYELPEGTTTILQDYINRLWQYFFIARADTSQYYYYANTGVSLKFHTDTIVYPMKISSISSSPNTTLYLYIISAHKMFFDGAELLYANRISGEELSAIKEDLPYLFNYIKEGDYITKLRRVYGSPSQMNTDIVIYQSPDDTEYRTEERPSYWYFGFANSMFLPFLLYTFYLSLLKIKKRKSNHK